MIWAVADLPWLTVAQAAKRLRVSEPRIYQLISDGKLTAQRFGRQLAIDIDSVKGYVPPKMGRPKKSNG